eukprot:CAMPEP_0194315004 /NCGR_PEP_ID=MMETSP0171-20130528/11807_1 /TAXON_ID=218684 /ORGANISM="Corethron pennatum, Strain L29A3" /LENGTH=374 /DNA_ID=CAMNT_0039070637 /DNA_START=46 /DNA_END=1170 /DNA_ORIENTATION=-
MMSQRNTGKEIYAPCNDKRIIPRHGSRTPYDRLRQHKIPPLLFVFFLAVQYPPRPTLALVPVLTFPRAAPRREGHLSAFDEGSGLRPPLPPSFGPYGRGTPIWPETGVEDGPVRLASSFPSGVVPEELREAATGPPPSQIRALNGIETSFSILALLVATCGLVPAGDVLFVAGMSAYVIYLTLALRSSVAGGDGIASLPERTYIPDLVQDPLGRAFSFSAVCQIRNAAAASIGFLLPAACLLGHAVQSGASGDAVPWRPAARFCGSLLFLISCQVTSEAVARRRVIPLPLRALLPAAYGSRRFRVAWTWAVSPLVIGPFARAAAVACAAYSAADLFGFVLPTLSMRYLRAHFFCVEAAEVTVKEGGGAEGGAIP